MVYLGTCFQSSVYRKYLKMFFRIFVYFIGGGGSVSLTDDRRDERLEWGYYVLRDIKQITCVSNIVYVLLNIHIYVKYIVKCGEGVAK